MTQTPNNCFFVLYSDHESVISSSLNAFVMVNQSTASSPVIHQIYSSNLVTDPYYVFIIHIHFHTEANLLQQLFYF